MHPAVGCLASVLVGLAGVACVFAVGLLATQGEIAFRRGAPNEIRLWLVRDGPNQGLGWSMMRVASTDESGAPRCIESRIRFLLWRSDGSARGITYCDCTTEEGEQHLEGSCPRGGP